MAQTALQLQVVIFMMMMVIIMMAMLMMMIVMILSVSVIELFTKSYILLKRSFPKKLCVYLCRKSSRLRIIHFDMKWMIHFESFWTAEKSYILLKEV